VDGLGNVREIESPDTEVETRTHDAAGNVITRTDARSKVSTYAYDANNRPTGITFSNSTRAVTYSYDSGTNAAGKRSCMSDASGSTAWMGDRAIDTTGYWVKVPLDRLANHIYIGIT